MAASEMMFSELAPGDPISQGGSLREFRYSQFSECPSAPFNTAEPECLPSQFHVSASLADSQLLEFEDHKYMPNGGRLGEPSSSLLCSHRNSDRLAEGVNCNPKCGDHLQPGSSISDSLKLSILDAHPGSKEHESSPWILEEAIYASDLGVSVLAQQDSPLHFPIQRSPRRIYCDRRLLEKETQVFDVGVSISKEQDLYLQSGTQHLQLPPQTTVAEVEKSLPILAVKQGCYATAEDFADICHGWHNGRGIAPTPIAILSSSPCSLPQGAKHEVIKLSTSSELDVDHFQRQSTDLKPENPSPCATKQRNSKAIEDDIGTVERCYIKRKISLAALNSLKLSTNIRFPTETKEIIKPRTSDVLDADRFRGQPAVLEPNNASPPTSTDQKILTAVDDDVNIVQRWNYRKRIASSAITNLSSSSDKKLKETPDKPVELGARLHSTELQDQLVKDPFLNGNENRSVPQLGYDTPCMDAISPMSGSETTKQDVNVNDDTDNCCDSKLRRKVNYPCAKDIKSFLQPVALPNKSTSNISSINAGSVSKEGHAEEKWTCQKKSGAGGRQRTIDAWIK